MKFVKIFCPYCNGFGRIERLELRLGQDGRIEELKISEECSNCLGRGIIEGTDKIFLPRPGALLYRVAEKEGGDLPN